MAGPEETSAKRFTFLNYNTPTHSASHRRAVKSHISSKYRTAVRQQAHPRYALPQRDDRSEGSSRSVQGDETPTDESRRKKKEGTNSPSTPSTPQNYSWPPTPSPLQIAFLGTRVDPFRSFPGQQTPCVVGALDYYTQVLSPLHQPLLVAVSLVNPMMSWALPVILSHESAFHAGVALSQAYLEMRQDPTARPSQEVGFHRYKAASLLRDALSKLEGPPGDGALVTVLALASLDVIYREDNMSNRKGLALMVALKGGLDNLGTRGLVKAYLIQFDYFWTLETGTQTIFPLAKRKKRRIYPQSPFQDNIISTISTLPPGFAAIAQQGCLGIDVLQILSRVSVFLQSKNANRPLSIDKDPVPEGQDYPDIFDACSCLHSAASTEHSLEKNICLAVIIFSFNMYSQTDSHSKITGYRGSRQELTRSLPFTPHRSPDEKACLVWIWVVVISSWRTTSALAPEGLLLSRKFFENFEEARSWTSIEWAMRRFFWYGPLKEAWKTNWREALDSFDRIGQCTVHPRGNCILTTTSSPATWQLKQEAPLLSSGERGSGRNSASTCLHLPDRTRHENEGQVAGDFEPTAAGSPSSICLPPMLTLETYLGQLR